jgi:large subunit ribosomal protein L21
VPKPDGSLYPTKSEAEAVTSRGPLQPSAVVVSGGKQYRVAPGDRILVDRLTAEPGASVKLDRVLLFNHDGDIKVGNPAVEGLDVEAKVIAHRRGPRIESIRYKSKKRVRVHHGGRADLTALEIIAVGGIGLETEKEEEEVEAKPKRREKAAPKKAASKEAAAPKAEAAVDEEAAEPVEVAGETVSEAPKKRATRRTKKETE